MKLSAESLRNNQNKWSPIQSPSFLSPLPTHGAVDRGGGRRRGRGVLGGSGERVLFSVMQTGSSPNRSMVLNLLTVIFTEKMVKSYSHTLNHITYADF